MATEQRWTVHYLNAMGREERQEGIPSRDAALEHACALRRQKCAVRKIVSSDGLEISHTEIDRYWATRYRP